MLRVFQQDLSDPDRFVITLELVPGTESRGRLVDKVLTIARDAYEDGRISAVSCRLPGPKDATDESG